jgi:hypothetical protein
LFFLFSFITNPARDFSGGGNFYQLAHKLKTTEVKENNSLTHQSLLTFSIGLELRRQTGLTVRILVLSKFLGWEEFFDTSGGLSRLIFRFQM